MGENKAVYVRKVAQFFFVSTVFFSIQVRTCSRLPCKDAQQYMGVSENVGYIPNEIAIFHRDNDQQNHWV